MEYNYGIWNTENKYGIQQQQQKSMGTGTAVLLTTYLKIDLICD